MLTFTDVTLARGPRVLLKGVNFALYAGWRAGIVGRNGTGKTSLFGLITGEVAPDTGKPPHLRLCPCQISNSDGTLIVLQSLAMN